MDYYDYHHHFHFFGPFFMLLIGFMIGRWSMWRRLARERGGDEGCHRRRCGRRDDATAPAPAPAASAASPAPAATPPAPPAV